MLETIVDLEIVIVSGRRPALLERTLASFDARLFRHFDISRVSANLDAFGGDEADHAACRKILTSAFPDIVLHEPQTPGFCAAVQRLWAGTTGSAVFHLEDDWLLDEDVRPADIAGLGRGNVAAMLLLSEHIDWTGPSHDLVSRKVRTRLFGLPIRTETRPIFGTSPGFFTGAFVREVAARMNTGLDPEKQMRGRKKNPALSEFVKPLRCQVLPGRDDRPIIRDIGRQWRDERQLEKIVHPDGRTEWRKRQAA
ncbi:hypothetical protein RM543_04335 [Roseicyclus sp. F158]|uniref:Glycosyltransferase family 2 protein n=1 Tax=Tropicimonas omnivorans TaxID=3075590 RepID=A0ABU3DDW0_9RHOB|nr:hypothetical protein [Roseicyclus sp. F158]MDT0681903.1 hypothetical protein [Roseicyclus sp. F158]